MNALTIIAQISDMHIKAPGRLAYGKVDTALLLARALETLTALPQKPQALLMTGDLTDFGRPGEYAHLLELLAGLDIPVLPLMGNHDSRPEFLDAFGGLPLLEGCREMGFVNYAARVGGVRVLTLDTHTPGDAAGRLCPERLGWLRAELQAEPETPTVVAMHHPPVHSFIGHMDEIGLVEGQEGLEELLAESPQVELVTCGHLHRFMVGRCGGVPTLAAPAPGHQVVMDLSEEALSRFVMEPGGLLVHAWSRGRGLATHQVFSGQWDGPYPFHDESGLID